MLENNCICNLDRDAMYGRQNNLRSDLLTNKFQPGDSLPCPQKSPLTVMFQRKRARNLNKCLISFAQILISPKIIYHHLFIKYLRNCTKLMNMVKAILLL